LVGDADLNRARAYALRKSAELRRNLQKEGSDERVAFVNEIKEFQDKETLVSMIILLLLPDIQAEALRDTKVKEPKSPKSDDSLEAQEKFQEEIDSYPVKFAKELDKNIQKISKERRKELSSVKKAELYSTYQALLMDRLCSEEMNSSYYDMCTYYATYLGADFKKPAFSSFDTFDNAATVIKTILVENYKSLELGIEELKKLPEATQ
jgi:hypothetical protein